MSKHLGQIFLQDILPGSISDDPQIRAAASVLSPLLQSTARAVPNLLLYARLSGQTNLLPPLARLTEARGGLQSLSLTELELMAWQFHVDFREVAQTPDQLATMVRQSIPWHRIKGTPASIKAALSLFGYSADIEEGSSSPYWATYQLGLPQIADEKSVRYIVSICNEMAPARCRLWRIYTEVFDRRPIVLSEGPVLGDGWLSFHSGNNVPVDPDNPGAGDVVVSFGTRHGWQSPPYITSALCASFGSTVHLGFLAPYIDRFMVGRSRLSDVYPRNHGFAMDSFFSILWADRATSARRWRGEWDARRWLDYTGFDRKLPQWRMGERAASRAQLVPGWGETLSHHNARLGATFAVTIDTPQRMGSFRLSEHDCQRRELRLHEMFLQASAASTVPVAPCTLVPPVTGGTARYSVVSPLPDPQRGQVARHDDLATYADTRVKTRTQWAGLSLVSVQSQDLQSDSSPFLGMESWRAPLWLGGWKEPLRTWKTLKKIANQ